MTKKLLFLISTLAFISCAQKEETNIGIYSINSQIIPNIITPSKLSEIADSVTFIPLETTNDVLLGYISAFFEDSLLIVSSNENGVEIFEPETGKYKYKIKGFKEKGPAGYSGKALDINKNNEVLIPQWDKHAIWNYQTGEITSANLPISPYEYSFLRFANDSLLIGAKLVIPSNSNSALDLFSAHDGKVLREYGFVETIDKNSSVTSMLRCNLYKSDGYINYYSMVRDTIYGINTTTLDLEPRIVLNLDKRLTPNEINSAQSSNGYMMVSDICESSRYLFIEFAYDDYIYLTYYDKKEKRTVCLAKDHFNLYAREGAGFEDDLTGSCRFFPKVITLDDKAYQIIQASDFITEVGSERAAEMGITEEDNPIIMIVHLKNML